MSHPLQSEIGLALVGSLFDSYDFKESGLIKNTMSVVVSGATYQLVSYYTFEDVMRGILNALTLAESMRHIRPRFDLTPMTSRVLNSETLQEHTLLN